MDKYEEAFRLIDLAVEAHSVGNVFPAILYYSEATQLFLLISNSSSKDEKEIVNGYISEYESILNSLCSQVSSSSANIIQDSNNDVTYSNDRDGKDDDLVEKGNFILSQAVMLDESGQLQSALPLYQEAAQLFLDSLKSPQLSTNHHDAASQIRKRLSGVLDRAEQLKSPKTLPNLPQSSVQNTNSLPTSLKRHQPLPSKASPKPSSLFLTPREKEILKRTSFINGKLFLPWNESKDICERFHYLEPFQDPEGLLELGNSQRTHFSRWVRPSQLSVSTATGIGRTRQYHPPTIVYLVSSYSVTQTVVSDCSFVASLSVCAAYERTRKIPLITDKIYPQNKNKEPVYNPSGKYMIKLFFNGSWRKVIVDDLLPVDPIGRLLCSYSSNPNELWVSLLEKAYLKVQGGYNFPGSTSEIDLFALTGWIPELVHLDKTCNLERTWKRLVDGMARGDCLVTASTSKGVNEEATGLVQSHAYAVLMAADISGTRILQLKNPWGTDASRQWKGDFSNFDHIGWKSHPELSAALNRHVNAKIHSQSGVFHISFKSLCQHFHLLHFSWNPKLFPFCKTFHSSWNPPTKIDRDCFSFNPQFSFKLNSKFQAENTAKVASIWVLLLKHVTQKMHRLDKFITLHVFENSGQKSKKVRYPDMPKYAGTYMNSPHYLLKFDVPLSDSTCPTYTLVVSQLDHTEGSSVDFTLKIFSTADFLAAEIPVQTFPFSSRSTGRWTISTAGGCPNFQSSYLNNPRFSLSLREPSKILVELFVKDCDFSVGIAVFKASGVRKLLSSGDYRKKYAMVEFETKEEELLLIPSTFDPGQKASFEIRVEASAACTLSPL